MHKHSEQDYTRGSYRRQGFRSEFFAAPPESIRRTSNRQGLNDFIRHNFIISSIIGGMKTPAKQILLTNDDGILSPGLWAAARALAELGYVWVAAPRQQYSSAGRSLPNNSDGIIEERQVNVNGQDWKVYAIGGSPAQAVQHALIEILPTKPDLVVSGINYGENVGTGVTVSGTIGAAMEAATFGIPALAVSLQLEVIDDFLSYSEKVDFSTAAFFTQTIARQMLHKPLPHDVDILKVEVPVCATPQTPWHITRQSRHRYYESFAVREDGWHSPGKIGARINITQEEAEPGSDIQTLLSGLVSVTPLSLDMTSRCDLRTLERSLKS